MPRWLIISAVVLGAAAAFACNDEIIQQVPKDVCLSQKQWIGGRHGDPRMFPGRDCVGCHLENDGPQLVLGGTVYPYVIPNTTQLDQLQSGEDCFGVEGVKVHVVGADLQEFVMTTNEAGNFYVEGDPKELVKPFSAYLEYTSADGKPNKPPMGNTPSYGGCAHCHTPGQTATKAANGGTEVREDLKILVVTRIGMTNVKAADVAAELGVPVPPTQ
ncbi:MAG TPA: hypothetical protein VG963_30645 [Polyangiaceae bacterium]|nr:hypothetical protein [Polyangiaceae bacterium]